jgi:hypothetical protein
LRGSGRVDDIQGHRQGEIRGLTNLIKITEDVRKFAAQQNFPDAEAVKAGMEQKASEFAESGAEIYSKT